MANCPEIKSSIFLGDTNLTSTKPIYFQGELVIKMYLGDKLVYSLKRTTKVK